MIHLDSDLLNSPERLLSEDVKCQQKIRELESLRYVLKRELEQHRKEGRIKGIFKANGITAKRVCREGKWTYSEDLQEREKKIKEEFEMEKQVEREDSIAVQSDPSFYWMIKQGSDDK